MADSQEQQDTQKQDKQQEEVLQSQPSKINENNMSNLVDDTEALSPKNEMLIEKLVQDEIESQIKKAQNKGDNKGIDPMDDSRFYNAVKNATRNKILHNFRKLSEKKKFQFVARRIAELNDGKAKHDDTATLLDKHWLEFTDGKHRYGNGLKLYHDYWSKSDTKQLNFWRWLDSEDGEGKNLSLEEYPRELLERDQVTYLGTDKDRSKFEVEVVDGKFRFKESGDLVDTLIEVENNDEVGKFIYIVTTDEKIFMAPKIRGKFHHTSLSNGRPVIGAGNLQISQGELQEIKPHSGHYRPTLKQFEFLKDFFKQKGINLDNVKIGKIKPKKKKKKSIAEKPFEKSHTFKQISKQIINVNRLRFKKIEDSGSDSEESESTLGEKKQLKEELKNEVVNHLIKNDQEQGKNIAQEVKIVDSLKNVKNKEKKDIQEQQTQKEFQIPESFINQESVPKFFKRGFNENSAGHRIRIQNYLEFIEQQRLVNILNEVDPSSEEIQPFFVLITSVLKTRNQNKKNNNN